MINPKSTNVPSVTNVQVGRKASAASINDKLTTLAHVEGRRLGVFSCQPPCASFDGDNTWQTSALSGSFYKTHGWLTSGSYEDVTGDLQARWCSTFPDVGAQSTTIHTRCDIRFNGSVDLAEPVRVPAQVSQSYCDNTSTAIGGQLTADTSGSFNLRPWAGQVNNVAWDPMSYASLYPDAGPMQFTTRDLKSVNLWLRDTLPISTVFFSGSAKKTESETDRAFVAGEVSLHPGSTVGLYDNALGYISQFSAYPNVGDQ